MEELEMFCALHQDIGKAVIVIGECGFERLEEIFSFTNMSDCTLVFSWTKKDILVLKERLWNDQARGIITLPEKLSFLSYYEFDGMEEEWGLYPVNCSGHELLAMIKYEPAYIVGSIKEGQISAYKIWEKCRNTCKEIHLKTWRAERPPVSLDWKKDSYEKELSIVFPVYNVENYIEQCIRSVTAWKADYVEFLFVSDGSKDASADIIRKYARNDKRILLIEKENGGCASARQMGLERVRGRYVGFIDPDDFIEINMFHKLLRKAMEGNFDISLCGYKEYYENSGLSRNAEDYIVQPYIDGCYDANKIKELVTYSRVAIWRGIYRTEFLRQSNIHFYTNIKRFDDLPFKVETFAFAKSVVMLPENLYYYRLEREGQDVAANDQRLYVHFDIFAYLDQSIGRTGNQQLIDYYQMCKLQTHRYALEKIQDKYKKEYLDRARKDLSALMNEQRTYTMTCILLGNEVAEDFRTIMQE